MITTEVILLIATLVSTTIGIMNGIKNAKDHNARQVADNPKLIAMGTNLENIKETLNSHGDMIKKRAEKVDKDNKDLLEKMDRENKSLLERVVRMETIIEGMQKGESP